MSKSIAASVMVLVVSFLAAAVPPPDLPGEELSHDFFLNLPRDTILQEAPRGTGVAWLDRAQKTWEAPSMAEQMASDKEFVPMGKGGVLVPRFTAAEREPVVEVFNSYGRSLFTSNAGSVINLEPGRYTVRFGSGTSRQRIVRDVTVDEGRVVPLLPDWAGLVIETIDSTANPFRGEYELVRIDEFEAYGRGLGADPDRGEVAKTWILKPGIYKILTIGQGYNSLTNFVTVRLVPGELTRLQLIQKTVPPYTILGGGTVDVIPTRRISSSWKYAANIGGSVKFNADNDRISDKSTASTLFGLLSTFSLTYRNEPHEWQTRVRLDEGFSLSGLENSRLLTDADDFLLNSLYILRILPWLGPYGSAQLRTNLLPFRIPREDKNFFSILDEGDTITPSRSFDSSSLYRLRPSFTPLMVNVAIGANIDALNLSFLETKIRGGFGSTFTGFPRRHEIFSGRSVNWRTEEDSIAYANMVANSLVLTTEAPTSTFEFGPQTTFSGIVRLGQFITADAELKIFAPLTPEERLTRPDFDLLSNISWRLSRWITLDYTYTFLLRQADDEASRIDRSTHGIYLRFSFASR